MSGTKITFYHCDNSSVDLLYPSCADFILKYWDCNYGVRFALLSLSCTTAACYMENADY